MIRTGMKRRLAAIALAALAAVQIAGFAGTTAQAGTIADTWETFKDNKHYRVVPVAAGLTASEDALAYMVPEVSLTRFEQTYNYDGRELVTNADAALVDAEVSFVDAWIAANIQNIVPNGSTYYAAIDAIEAWLDANVTLTMQNATDRSYYGAYHAFADGTGISTTYACAFNSLVHALPFDATGNVNYESGTTHLQTTLITNVNESWSGVNVGTSWLYYDTAWGKAHKANVVYEQGSADITFNNKAHWVR